MKRKVRLCVKVFNFFRGRILFRLTWNLSRFVPNSMEILTWNLRKKNYFGIIFQKFCANQGLYRNLWNFALLSKILFWVRIALKKFTQVLSYVVCTQVRRHAHKKNHKKKIRGKKARTFCIRKTSFIHPRSLTYYALLLRYFGLQFLPDVLHRSYWVLDEIWATDWSHKNSNKFFIHHC